MRNAYLYNILSVAKTASLLVMEKFIRAMTWSRLRTYLNRWSDLVGDSYEKYSDFKCVVISLAQYWHGVKMGM